jgi:hypothetical protein
LWSIVAENRDGGGRGVFADDDSKREFRVRYFRSVSLPLLSKKSLAELTLTGHVAVDRLPADKAATVPFHSYYACDPSSRSARVGSTGAASDAFTFVSQVVSIGCYYHCFSPSLLLIGTAADGPVVAPQCGTS